jgi:GH24 family phage-related lysozyme (muramidase)
MKPLNAEQKRRLRGLLVLHEGKSNKAYFDKKANPPVWTIGVGHALPNISDAAAKQLFWTDDEVYETLDGDIADAWNLVMTRIGWAWSIDDVRQTVLAELAFNLGSRLLLFRKTLMAMQSRNWANAKEYLFDSKWRRQDVSNDRSDRIASMLVTGRWPSDVKPIDWVKKPKETKEQVTE